MAQIGSFANINFATSDRRVLTPSNFKRKVSSQWGQHDLIGQKPKSEYLGAGQGSVTFTMLLDMTLGVDPKSTINNLEYLCESGYVDYLVIGNRTIGSNRFYISAVSESWDVVYSGGRLARAKVDVTMNEYV